MSLSFYCNQYLSHVCLQFKTSELVLCLYCTSSTKYCVPLIFFKLCYFYLLSRSDAYFMPEMLMVMTERLNVSICFSFIYFPISCIECNILHMTAAGNP